VTILAPTRFLDLRALAALGRLRFTTGRRLEGAYSGRHVSRSHGGAAEFADFREYSEGEDLRRLDWKILARTGRAYTRLYQNETNIRCILVLDASSSMAFGSGITKLEYAQYLATALSYVIGRQQDQVGLAVAAEGLEEFVGLGATLEHVAQVHERIAALCPKPVTDLDSALAEVFQRLKGRGILLVQSDFLVDELQHLNARLRQFRQRAWEIILLHIIHPQEEDLPVGAAYRFEGLEGEDTVNCSPAQIRDLYRDLFERHAAAVRGLAASSGCDYRRVSTRVPYLDTLRGFLIERGG
jgi:uncharacterized protein (DUF58 family)